MQYLDKSFYVANTATPGGDGTISAPFATLTEAKEAVRAYRQEVGPFMCVHITVYLRKGIYKMEETFALTEEEGGSDTQQVTYKAFPSEEVIFDAGEKIDTSLFRPVTSEEATLLKDGMADHVHVADLKDYDLDSLFPIPENDALNPMKVSDFGFLAWDGVMLQNAQWPNHGYAHINEVFEPGPSTRFLLKGESAPAYSWEKPTGARFNMHESMDFAKADKELQESKEVFCFGFPDNDWFFQKEQVQSFANDEVKFLRDTRYGIKNHMSLIRRVRFVNLLCELDEPGEWYYDRKTCKLYLYPLAPLTPELNLVVLGKTSPVISLQNTTNVEFRDIIIQNGGDLGILIEGGKDNLIGGCTLRNFSGLGIRIHGGVHNGITGSSISGMERAFHMIGGIKKTFTPANHYVTNCEIFDIRNRGYELGFLDGFAMLFAHNIVHDTNGGIMFSECGEFIAEYNEFYRVGLEMGDWNPLYSGANCVAVGSILRYNFIHHMMELPEAYPLGGMRGDDNDVGNTYYGNIFYKAGRRGIDGHGPATHVINNIIMACEDGVGTVMQSHEKSKATNAAHFADCYNDNFVEQERKGDFWRQMLQHTGDRFCYNSPEWSFRYPLLRMLMNKAPINQSYTEITYNYYNDCTRGFLYTHGGTIDDYPVTALLQPGVEISMDAFKDVESLDFSFKDDFKPMDGFYPIPFEEIGLKLDEYRYTVPDKTEYRSAVYKQYDGIRSCSGVYNMEKENDHYPLAAYKTYNN